MTTKDDEEFLESRGAFLGLLHEIGHAHDYERKPMEPIEAQIISLKRTHGLEHFPDNYLEVYVGAALERERKAWTYALKTLRDTKEKGIDLENAMSVNDILSHVQQSLGSYTTGSHGLPVIDRKGRKV